ncbi:MAG: hypothetical protein RIS17_899 [Pseudomonadota bacterium]
MTRPIALAAAVILAATAPAVANAQAARAAATARAPDAATMQAAAAVVAQLGIKAKLQQQMAGSVAQMKSGAVIRAMLAQQPGFVPAYQANKAKFDPVLAKAGAIQAEIAQGVINQNLDSVVTAATRAYAQQFTAQELMGMLAFYRSAAGQAMLRKEPAVAAAISNATGQLIGAKIDAAMQANSKRLGAALAPLNSQPQQGRKP